MKSFDLRPTKENLMEKLKEDSLGRNNAIYRFIRLLLSIEDATTISLDGDWGSGKTFFVKQVKLVLEAYNPNFNISNNKNNNINKDDVDQIKDVMSNINILAKKFFSETLVNNPQFVVYYDAWENDDEVDPVLSLIFRIVESINENFDIKIELPDMIKKLLETLIKMPKIIDKIPVLKNVSLIFSLIKDCKAMVKFNSVLKNQKQNNNLKQEIKNFLSSLLSERGNKLIILIDELDRCSPSYAVKILERIKHYFDDDRIIFAFSTDLSQLTHTIKKYYGEGYDSCRYLNRFFDLKFRLPEVSLEKYCNSIDIFTNNSVINNVCRMIIKEYNLSLRQINKFYRLVKISICMRANYNMITELINIFKTTNINLHIKWTEFFCTIFIIPLAIVLSIINNELYYNFIKGKNSYPLVNLINLYKDKINKDIELLFLERSSIEEGRDMFNFHKMEPQIHISTMLDKEIEKMYEVIFIKDYIEFEDIITIGKLKFDIKIKETIHDSLNLLSDLSYF